MLFGDVQLKAEGYRATTYILVALRFIYDVSSEVKIPNPFII